MFHWKLTVCVAIGSIPLLFVGCASPLQSPSNNGDRSHEFQSLAGEGLDSRSPFHSRLQEVRNRIDNGRAEHRSNSVAILDDGREALLLRIHLIRHARSSVDIQTFIWTHDEVGELIMRELLAAARRGVRVRVIVDHFGVPKDPNVIAYLETVHPNLEIKIYRPPVRELDANVISKAAHTVLNFRGVNQRMHDKTFIVDGVTGITGGRNYENTYFNQSTRINYKDRDALVIGPAATQMLNAFECFWESRHSVSGRDLSDVARTIRNFDADRFRNGNLTPLRHRSPMVIAETNVSSVMRRTAGRMRSASWVEYLFDRPGKNESLLLDGGGRHTEQLLGTLNTAENEIVIQSPYLILSRRGANFFRQIRQRHPNLKIVISTNSLGSTDNLFAYSANVRLREMFVHDLGFQIFEYKSHPDDLRRILPEYDELQSRSPKDEPFLSLHGKSIVIDDATVYVGTFNIDPRSENLNTEGGLIIRDPMIASVVKADILRDIRPGNSWIMAPVLESDAAALTSEIDTMGRLISDILPVDVVPPLNSISAFELLPGRQAVSPGHSEFHRNYRSIGRWPSGKGRLSDKEILARLLHTTAKSATPLF